MWPLPRNEWLGPSLKLGSICKEWRQIAWDTPQLWTNVIVCLDRCKPLEHHTLLRDWISRSKTLPLTVLVHSAQYPNFEDDKSNEDSSNEEQHMCPNEYYSLLDLAAQCSSRWKEIMVWVSMTCTRYLFSKADDMSNVDVLELYPTTWATDVMDPTRYGLLDNKKAAGLFLDMSITTGTQISPNSTSTGRELLITT